ncbi:MAG: helix-turn-helix transcriptional regulator, partial [Oscillospiraceae bacterium]|nr:helix-turn-helix transcriptional regulator [Oscillospiraceae bacterium]
MKMTIGTNIKRLRSAKNITQEQLAGYLGVSSQAVSRWECGTACPDISLLPQLADFFEITVDELLG